MEQGGGINPYAAPGADALVAEMPVTGSGAKLAGRGARLGAAIIDSLVAMSVLTPLQFAMGVYDGFPKIKPLTIPQTLGWSAFGLVFWLAVHSYFVVNGSQTLGKRLLGLQIVNATDDKPAPYGTIVLVRYIPVHLATLVPYVGGLATLVDALCIFRKDYRCIHDHIAGTRVIVKPPG